MSVPPRLILIALCAIACMSFVPVLIKSVAANEITIGIIRLGIAIALLTPLLLIKNYVKGLTQKDWLGLLAIGLCFGLHWITYFYSIKLASASIGAIAVSTFGIHLLLLNALFKKQSVRGSDWFTIILCFIGCLMLLPGSQAEPNALLGLIVGIFSGLLYAAMPLLHQRLPTTPTLVRVWGQFFFALLCFLPFVGFSQWNLTSVDWWQLGVLGVVCTVIAHSLWVKASTELPASITGVVYYLYIPLAMVMSWYFLDEKMSVSMILGAALIIAANISQVVFNLSRSKPHA